MRLSIKPEQLSGEVQKTLEKYWYNLKTAVDEAMEMAASQTVDYLHQGGPYTERTGKYTKSWTYKKEKTYKSASIFLENTYIIYNQKPNYRLTHLLEHGHVIRSKSGKTVGAAGAFVHISPAEDFAAEAVTTMVEQRVRAVTIG